MRFRVTSLPLLAGAGLTLIAGCATAEPSARARLADVRTGLSREELGDQLAQFEDTYEAVIREAAERIAALDPGKRTRRLVLLWQTRMLPMARDALNQDDPVHALLDVWALCLRMHHYFHDGDGRALFGDHQDLARQAAERALEAVEQVAAAILSPDMLDRARQAVDDLARQFPIRGEFSGSPVRTAVQRPDHGADVLAAIVTAPFAPFRAVEGIDRGAAAIRGFSAVAARMNETIHDLPELTRLQAELLLLEIENLESTRSALAAFAEFAQASSRFSAAVERLPEDLRRELVAATEDLDRHQAGLQQTLAQAREVVDRINEGLRRADESAAAVERTAVQTARAGEAWTGTFQAITDMVAGFRGRPTARGSEAAATAAADGPTADEPPGPDTPAETPAPTALAAPAAPSNAALPPAVGPDTDADRPRPRPFDILEYAQTAEALDRAADRLTVLTRELRDLAGSKELQASLADVEARLDGLVGRSRGSAREITDHAAWRAAQLIVLTFVLLIVYQVARRDTSTGHDA